MKMTEMEKLINKLAKADIPYELTVLYDTIQVWYPSVKNNVADVVCHEWSMGNKDGLLEIMGLVDETKTGDVVEGYLTADEIFERIAKHYRTHKTAEEVKTNTEADWIDYWFIDLESEEEFFVEVKDTDHAKKDAWAIAKANFANPRLMKTITPEEAEWYGYDTY
jgi:hypothetical protein